MKQKASITLSSDLLKQLDRATGGKYSRSAFIERILRQYLRERARAAIDARDLALINKAADRLKEEALDVLEYQASWDEIFPER